MQTHGPELDEAFVLLRDVVDDCNRTGRRTIAAGLKPMLQARTFGGFSEARLGFSTFRDFLHAAAERKIVTLRRVGEDIAVFSPEQTPPDRTLWEKAEAAKTAATDATDRSVRPDFWKTFTDWGKGWRRVYDREADRAVMFPEDPAPLEPREFVELRNEWRASPERYVQINPVPQDVHIGWMRDFAESVEDPTIQSILSQALHADYPAAAFSRAVRGFPSIATRWHEFRLAKVGGVITAWMQKNELDVPFLVSRPRTGRSLEPSQHRSSAYEDAVRSAVVAAVKAMPLHELLRLSIPVEYMLTEK